MKYRICAELPNKDIIKSKFSDLIAEFRKQTGEEVDDINEIVDLISSADRFRINVDDGRIYGLQGEIFKQSIIWLEPEEFEGNLPF